MSSKTYMNAYLHTKMIFNKIKEKYQDSELQVEIKKALLFRVSKKSVLKISMCN